MPRCAAFSLDRIAMTRGHGVACRACWLVRWVGRKLAPTATRRSLVRAPTKSSRFCCWLVCLLRWLPSSRKRSTRGNSAEPTTPLQGFRSVDCLRCMDLSGGRARRPAPYPDHGNRSRPVKRGTTADRLNFAGALTSRFDLISRRLCIIWRISTSKDTAGSVASRNRKLSNASSLSRCSAVAAR